MDVILLCTFAADGTYYEAEADLDEDPMLSEGDTVKAVPNMWPTVVEEVKYIVEEEEKVYSISPEKRQEKNFLGEAHKSDKWHLYPETS